MDYWDFPTGRWYWADCFDALRDVPDGSVDMVLCDLPYGTTQNKWDSVLPLEPLWAEYWRVAKPNAAIVLTARSPFDKILGVSQIRNLRYEWIWEKTAATGFLNAKKAPLKAHENILVFARAACPYFPQMVPRDKPRVRKNAGFASHGANYAKKNAVREPYESTETFPRSVVVFPKDSRGPGNHPTQKPVALFEYLIKTYTNPGETVLDNTAGSGTTAVAAHNTGRRWVCMERELEYTIGALDRIGKLDGMHA